MNALQDSTVAIVGLGLMGGSLALALRQKNACRKIIGITRTAQTRAAALTCGAVDLAGDELALAAEADAIILAAPVRAILNQLPQIGQIAREGTLVMDLGSTKREVARAMQDLPAHLAPIGAHPMCGKETAGFAAADANLYRNAVFVLTPLARTPPSALSFAEHLAVAVGARPLTFEAARHDKLVAAISHLPFALSATLVTVVDELARADDMVYTLAASGFRDTSRLAASDTTMMLDILLTNRKNVIDLLHAYSHHLQELANQLAVSDEAALQALLERAAASRRRLFK